MRFSVVAHLLGIEDLSAKDEELVSLILIERIHDQALPQDIDLRLLEGFAGRGSREELEEVQSPVDLFQVVQLQSGVSDQVAQKVSVLGRLGVVGRAVAVAKFRLLDGVRLFVRGEVDQGGRVL